MLRIRRQRLEQKLESLTIDAIDHHDETDHRIVQQLGGRRPSRGRPGRGFRPGLRSTCDPLVCGESQLQLEEDTTQNVAGASR
jgi:hypothetical protein